MPSLQFTTLRVGLVRIESQGQVFESDVRLLLDSDGGYRVLQGGLSEPLGSLEEAMRRVEQAGDPVPEVAYSVHWRQAAGQLEEGESACPVCGAPAYTLGRYRLAVCPACRMELTDELGRPLETANEETSGGLRVSYRDSGETYEGEQYFVRGRLCRVAERQFGGVAVQVVEQEG